MGLTLVLLLLAAVVLVGLVWGVLRIDHVDETERFHRAREITTSWAEPGPRFQTVPDVERLVPPPSEDDSGTQPS